MTSNAARRVDQGNYVALRITFETVLGHSADGKPALPDARKQDQLSSQA